MLKTIKIFLLSAVILGFGVFAFAQEDVGQEVVSEEVLEEVLAQDLDVSEPRLLPDSPFYFLKNWWRGVRSFFTFDPLKKTELKQKFANEKLLELKKLTKKTKNPRLLQRAAKSYQKEVEGAGQLAERLKERIKDRSKLQKFSEKFTRHQFLHQRILEKLEEQVPEQAFEEIKEARERHLERFGEVMSKLETGEKQLEILEGLKSEIRERPELQEKLETGKINVLERIKERAIERDCPQWAPPAPGFCKEGRVIVSKDEQGCPLPPRCIVPGEKTTPIPGKIMPTPGKPIPVKPAPIPGGCIALWNPVCSKDGKTYSNACFAKVAGVEIAHRGECQE